MTDRTGMTPSGRNCAVRMGGSDGNLAFSRARAIPSRRSDRDAGGCDPGVADRALSLGRKPNETGGRHEDVRPTPALTRKYVLTYIGGTMEGSWPPDGGDE